MRRLSFVIAFASSFLLGESACGAPKTLTRDAALKILRQQESKLLHGDELRLFHAEIWVPGWRANDDETVALHSRFVAPELQSIDEAASKDNRVRVFRDRFRQMWLDGYFLLALSHERFIGVLHMRNTSEDMGLMNGYAQNYPGLKFICKALSPPGFAIRRVDPLGFGTYSGSGTPDFVTSATSDHFLAVTGITGEGEMRSVDVTISHDATATLKKLRELAWNVAQEHGVLSGHLLKS